MAHLIIIFLLAVAPCAAVAASHADDTTAVPRDDRLAVEIVVDTATLRYDDPARLEAAMRHSVELRQVRLGWWRSSEIQRLLPVVFFDAGSPVPAVRYRLLGDRAETVAYDDSTEFGSAMAVNHDVLNVVGFRLRRFPGARVHLQGLHSSQPEVGETAALADRRAEYVRRYLVEVWGIDSARVGVLPVRVSPSHTPGERNAESDAERRCVRIISSDWEILRPVTRREVRYLPAIPAMRFRIRNPIQPDSIASQTVVVTSGGECLTTLPVATGHTVTETLTDVELRAFAGDFGARLVVALRDGSTRSSRDVSIPVTLAEVERPCEDCDPRLLRFSLNTFHTDAWEGTELDRRLLREYIGVHVSDGARVTITGYAWKERGGEDLAMARAAWTLAALRAERPDGFDVELVAVDDLALHDPALPEGRCLSRAVQVVIREVR